MPQVLTVQAKPDETPEQFAARIATEMTGFFDEAAGESTDSGSESTEPAPESTDETSTDATPPSDVSPAETDTTAAVATPKLEVDFDMAAQFQLLLDEFARGPGWVTNPKGTKRIHDYWTKKGEEGYAKVAWGTPGDFKRCVTEVGQEIAEGNPEKLKFIKSICAQWHHDAIGVWPGQEDGGRGKH
jgi:hypothetical protein